MRFLSRLFGRALDETQRTEQWFFELSSRADRKKFALPVVVHLEVAGHAFEDVVRARVRGLLAAVLQNAAGICGTARPEILVFGVSAGASAMATVACEFAAVSTMLLVAPSADAGNPEMMMAGITAFRGDLFVVHGACDEVVGNLPRLLFDRAAMARRRERREISQCDHQFRGAINGRVLSQAPLWAFAGQHPFPAADAGMHLYE